MVDQNNSDEVSEHSANVESRADAPVKTRRRFRLGRLVLKELRETLRDRRTIVTLLLMPLLVYPALSLVFKTYLLSNVGMLGGDTTEMLIAYDGEGDQKLVYESVGRIISGVNAAMEFERKQAEKDAKSESDSDQVDEKPKLDSQNELSDVDSEGVNSDDAEPDELRGFNPGDWFPVHEFEKSIEQLVEDGEVDIGVKVGVNSRERWELAEVEIIARDDPNSQYVAEYVRTRLEKFNDFALKQRLARIRVPFAPAVPVSVSMVGPEEADSPSSFPLASLVPLILVLMTITGAVYPAIDLTAGERERGTLETLMAAPVPRFGILFSKFLAVLTVAILTAVLNLIGMFATVWAFQLDKQFGGGMFNATVMLQIFLLLILFAAFFSALLLVVTSFAKSFKEAQVYLIPIILLSLGPGLMAMAPGMSLDGVYAVVPMMNILLLARDVILGEVLPVPATIAVLSTLFYSYLAIRTAARIFGSDGILNAGSGNFVEMFHRPIETNYVVPILATLFCLVLLFPINFASIGFLGRLPSETTGDLQYRYLLMGVFTFIAFMVVPWLVARHQNTNIKSGFGINAPRFIFLVAAVLIGVSLWTVVMSLTETWHEAYGILFGAEKQAAWHHRLVEVATEQIERISKISPVVIVLCFSIIPAVCEEWFFRGMLFRSLLKTKSVWKAILISAFVFGAFHTLSNSAIAIDRLVPSTLVGVMLAYLAYKSDSIVPGIVLHSIHNAIVVLLAYYGSNLREFSWFPGEEEPIPMTWVLIGCGITAVGVLLIWMSKTRLEAEGRNSEMGVQV